MRHEMLTQHTFFAITKWYAESAFCTSSVVRILSLIRGHHNKWEGLHIVVSSELATAAQWFFYHILVCVHGSWEGHDGS